MWRIYLCRLSGIHELCHRQWSLFLLYVCSSCINCFEWEVQFENYLMLNGDITVVMRMGGQPLCSADEIILSAQLGTLKHSYWNLHVQISTHSDLQLVCCGWWFSLVILLEHQLRSPIEQGMAKFMTWYVGHYQNYFQWNHPHYIKLHCCFK